MLNSNVNHYGTLLSKSHLTLPFVHCVQTGNKTIRMASFIVICIQITGLTASAATFDQVHHIDGGKNNLRGSIKSISRQEIVIESSGGQERTVAVNEVAYVEFKKDPVELRAARRDMFSGNFRGVLEKLDKIDKPSINQPNLIAEIDFYEALAIARLALTGDDEHGNQKAAASKVVEFRSNHKDSFHYYDAVEVLGELAKTLELWPAANKFYKDLESAPWPDVKLQAIVLQGNAMVAQGEFNKALEFFERVRNDQTESGPLVDRQRQLATVGVIYCHGHLSSEDAEKGITVAADVLKMASESDFQLLGRLYNALGVCYAKSGQPKDAILSFLKTDILFPQERETHAEALYRLAPLWDNINRKDRALRARSSLKTMYPESKWAKLL